MKKFDLDNTVVSKLTPIEIIDLKEYLMNCRLRIRTKFILQIMDNEYILLQVNNQCELFLADRIFDNVRNLILNKELRYVDDLSQNEWLEIEGNFIRKIRREKLIQLNNIIS